MIPFVETTADPNATPIWPVGAKALDSWLEGRDDRIRTWVRAVGFTAGAGKTCLVSGSDGNLAGVILGLGDDPDLWAFGALSTDLPTGRYRIDGALPSELANGAALAWALGSYQFDRYRKAKDGLATLHLPDGADADQIARTVTATFLGRDLINTPAEDMGPGELAAAVEELGKRHDASCRVVVGDALLEQNYPAIHAVGRAAARAPRLIDLTWGDPSHPKVTLVGKGVCFDTGGLDLKPSAGMLKMKKDMGGAATTVALAAMIMDAGLPVRLRLMVPAVENAVAGNAYRPGDVLQTRKGLTVEVGNTDAEGRIVLCDALADADTEKPDLMIDCATLTGAARVALGPDLPALFTNDDAVAAGLAKHGDTEQDPLWRMPLYAPYAEKLKSKVADLNNVSDGPFAGAVTAALYLQSFVTETSSWAHIDTYGWSDVARPGRPAGGEPLALRSLYAFIRERYAA